MIIEHMSIERKIPEWNLEEALNYIRNLQEKFWETNYHLALAGSVLNYGISSNDLDIIVLPFCNGKVNNILRMQDILFKCGAELLTDEKYIMGGRTLYRTTHPRMIDWFVY